VTKRIAWPTDTDGRCRERDGGDRKQTCTSGKSRKTGLERFQGKKYRRRRRRRRRRMRRSSSGGGKEE